MKKLFVICVCLVSFLYGKPMLSDEAKLMIKEAKQEVKSVSAKRLDKLIKNNKTIVLDVRNPNEWKKGVIKSDKLVKLSRGFLEIKYTKKLLGKYSKNDKIIVYCGVEPRAILASKTLKDLGFTNVKYLRGGYFNWRDEGYPISK